MLRATLVILLLATGAVAQEAPVRIVDLHPLWEVGGMDDEEVLFGVLSDLAVDDEGMVYVVDRQLTEVTCFSPDGEFLGLVGREGEGPGEYSRIGAVFATGADEVAVVQRMPGRIVTVRRDGTPGDPIALPTEMRDAPAYFFDADRAGDDLVLSVRQMRRQEAAVGMNTLLIRVDAEGNEIARLSERSVTRDMSNLVVDERDDTPAVWAAGPNGMLYVSDTFDAYSIRVFDADGALSHELTREYLPRKRSDEEKELNTPRMMVRRRGGGGGAATGIPSPTDRDIQSIYPRPDGSVWVLNSHGAFDDAPGILATLDVFDPAGQWTGQVALEGEGSFRDDGIHIVGDRVYVARGLRAALRASRGQGEEEDMEMDAEPMSLACYAIASSTPDVAGGKR